MMIIVSILDMLFKIFLFLLIALLMMLLLILLIPFNYTVSALLKEKLSAHLHFNWTMFHVELFWEDMKPSMKIAVFRRTIMSGPIRKRAGKKPEKKAGKSKFKMYGMEFFNEILSFLIEIFNILKPREVTAVGCYGLDDPADTALVSFIIGFINDFAPWAHIRLSPVFDSEMTEVEINASGRIMLIILVCIFLKYIFRTEVRKVLFQKRTDTET